MVQIGVATQHGSEASATIERTPSIREYGNEMMHQHGGYFGDSSFYGDLGKHNHASRYVLNRSKCDSYIGY